MNLSQMAVIDATLIVTLVHLLYKFGYQGSQQNKLVVH